MFTPVDPHPDFPKLEEAVLKFWEKEKIFEKSLVRTKKGKPFTFYDGPPFATGLPHYGHILASTIKDVIPRYQTMRGRFVRRRWGWDCHGLPIEEIVERKLKISGKKEIERIGIKKFNETCRRQVLTYAHEWGKTVRRIARWVDFENSYQTMDRDYMESVWWAFKEIYNKDLVYEGRKVLLYCPRCETPVSNFEVAMDNSYQEVTEEAVIAKFKILDSQFPNTYFLAWTTTPWTLPGNVALAIGKSIKYLAVNIKGNKEIYILAADLAEKILNTKYEILNTFLGKDLVGIRYEPLYDIAEMQGEKSHRVYDADFVTTEEGTGIVHTAVVYGEEDYEMGQRLSLPVVPLLDEKGIFNDKVPALIRRKYFKDSEEIIKNDLSKRGLLLKKEMHTHSYPHCWRCGTALFYNAIPAWFVNIRKIKNELLDSNKKQINWYPDHLKFGRYAKSVESAPDWNISRNRYWGNPIPVWRCGECGKNTVVGSVKELRARAVDPSGINEKFDLHRPYIDGVVLKCAHCGGEARRITEIFDSWFEAAAMPFAEYHYPFENGQVFKSRFPAQFVAEYIAQTRAWFYVMHVISLILFGKAPFENVVTTGTILAEDGTKMSKSKNNYPDPWVIMEKYGVDSLRFYLMTSVVMRADNLNFSERDLANVYKKVILILWNIYNYFITYANKRQREIGQKSKAYQMLDDWMDALTEQLVFEVTKNLEKYDTVVATRAIEGYIDSLSTWYLRRSRGRGDDGFFETLQNSLQTLCKIMAPFTPYIAEIIYSNISQGKSVHLEDWPKAGKLKKTQEDLILQMEQIRKFAEEAHSLRAQAGIKLRQPLQKLKVKSEKLKGKELLDILKDEVNVLEIEFGNNLELATKITLELKIAGLARELERQIQQLRKESGLAIGELVDLYYDTKSDMIEQALKKVDKKKIYVSGIHLQKAEKADFEKKMELEGEKVKLSLKISNF